MGDVQFGMSGNQIHDSSIEILYIFIYFAIVLWSDTFLNFSMLL